MPFTLQSAYGEEFDIMEKIGILTRIGSSEWGTPVVPVLKPSEKLRICGKFKSTINEFLVKVNHPLPRIEEYFS